MLKKEFIIDNDIVLREISLNDVPSIFTAIDNEREYLGEWLPFVDYTREADDTRAVVGEMIASSDKNLTFSIQFQKSFAGLIGLKDFDFINKKTEIGYWLSEKYQHKGIITKSCEALIEYAFEELDMYRIQLNAAAGNKKSQAVAERLGFTKEGVMRSAELHSRGFLDIVVFGLLKPDWKNRNKWLS
ncbi:MAG: GNAT family N-acetyltransferase [Prevotellaceae bacterium]|jgi:ribosomal-protein-serine acetyltransferase|nr:GNAT family N-acetyltransferase [Prevotellaceae bacterium]